MTRKVPITEWPCPHHEYPVGIGGGWEEGAFPPDALPEVEALLERIGEEAAGPAWVEFGMCCRGLEWQTVGWREAGAFEELLYEIRVPK